MRRMAEESRLHYGQGQGILLFSEGSRPALVPTQTSCSLATGAVTLLVTWLGHEADQCSTRVQN
jgi:hypothetical protein